jgi:cyclopropane fatty-acyl-phospholipid synthase-like methyltransferase
MTATNDTSPAEEYTPDILTVLQLIWGEGFLSPGGEAALDAIVTGLGLRDKAVLDIGCGLGGYDVLLARKYGARVIGLDVEAAIIEHGRRYVAQAGQSDRVELRLTSPGPLPLPDASADVVFGKDAWIHIEDKRAFFREVYRVLKPGGVLAASDWMRSDRPYGEAMRYFFKMEGLTYHMDTLEHYGAMLREIGFREVELTDTSDEYRVMGHEEFERLKSSLAPETIQRLGPEKHAYFVEDWRSITVVLDSGELRTGRLRARK